MKAPVTKGTAMRDILTGCNAHCDDCDSVTPRRQAHNSSHWEHLLEEPVLSMHLT